jgi:hypothetical protein
MKPDNSFGVCAVLRCVFADCYLGQVLLVFDSTGDMGHPSIDIGIGRQKGGGYSRKTDQQSNIWVTKDVFIKKEPN